MKYETVFIARQDISPAHVEELAERFTKVITSHEGTTNKTEYCGLRPLAYPIMKNRKGHYVLINIDAPAAAITELERQMRINEDILRYLTVKVEEHEEGPSALFKQSRSYIENATRGQIFRTEGAEEGEEDTQSDEQPQDKA